MVSTPETDICSCWKITVIVVEYKVCMSLGRSGEAFRLLSQDSAPALFYKVKLKTERRNEKRNTCLRGEDVQVKVQSRLELSGMDLSLDSF